MPRKFKFETVNDAKRVTKKLFDALYKKFGYGHNAFAVCGVTFANSNCKTQANVLMYASYTTKDNPIVRRVGIDEFGKVFFYSDCRSYRSYI